MNTQLFEQFLIKHWPALDTMEYDGWLLCTANGFTKRANSISILHASTLDIEDKLTFVEQYYQSKNIPAIFKIGRSELDTQLDQYLEQHNYDKLASTLVLSTTLTELSPPTTTEVEILEHISIKWIEHYCQFSGNSEEVIRTMIDMLTRIDTTTLLITLKNNNKAVACGLGVIEDGYVGVYCIATDPEHRHSGYGEQLMLNLLHCAKERGAHSSYLVVEESNEMARKLYDKLNFKLQYQYWYRVKPTNANIK